MTRLLGLLIALTLLFSGCATLSDPLSEAASPLADVHSQLPVPGAPNSLRSQETVTLYFRYLDEPYLAPESRPITLSPDQSREMALLSALLSGPDVQSPELSACFPTGVKALSTVRQGRTLFVTLSAQIMNSWPDEPSSWRDDPYWAQEAPLRRKLAMQSLIATITENCSVDSVQVLVEQSGYVTDSLRLRERYYLTTDDASLLAPALRRDDSLLLTPHNTLQTILTLWHTRDWTRLNRYLALNANIDLAGLPHLTGFTFTGGAISPDGQSATFTLDATLRAGQTESSVTGRILRLHREAGLWRISPDQLTGWLEDGR